MKTSRIPAIYVYDKQTGTKHLVGSDSHDSLYVDKDGGIHYYNLQNGDGTHGDYEFVVDDNGYSDSEIPFLSPEDYLKALD